MKVSVFIATSGRPKMLIDMLDSLAASTNWTRGKIEMETIFVIDGDVSAYDIASKFPPFEGTIIDFSWQRRGALWAWNRGLQLSSGDILVPAGDDQLFYGNWLDYALESHREKLGGYGVVGMNDLAYDGNTQVATMWLFDRTYCRQVMGGIFAPPVYRYFCVDLEWNEKAKSLNRFFWDERARVEHLHSAHGKRPVDNTDKFKEDIWVEIDNQTFADRKARGFPVEWEPLI